MKRYVFNKKVRTPPFLSGVQLVINADYYIKVLAEKPEWIAEAHQLGMKVNVWTVNDMEMVQKMIDQQVDYITTDYPLETEKLIRKNGGDS